MRHQHNTGRSFPITKEESFPGFNEMVGWLAKRVPVRKALEAELKEHLDSDPDAYKGKLHAAWQQASGVEKEYLQEALFDLKVDPAKWSQSEKRGVELHEILAHH